MKTRVLYLFAALIIFVSCINDEVTTIIPDSDEFYCSIENEESTRTSLDQNNNVIWSAEDQLVIFKKNSIPSKYQISDNHVGKTSGSFYKVNPDEFNAGLELDHNVALYPYQENLEITKLDTDSPASSYKITGYNFPAEQTYEENSFADGTFPMAAVSDNYDLTFRNICGGIKLQLKGTQKVTSIKIQGNNNERLAGVSDVVVYSEDTMKPVMTMASNASAVVTLNCGDGIQLSESAATDFIIALPPVLFSKGFTVTVTDSDDETYTIDTDNANTVLRSSILVMPTIILGNEVTEDEEDDNGDNIEYPVEAVTLNKTSLTLAQGTSYSLVAKVVPTNATDKTLTWSSSAYTVAIVDESGIVTALSDGTATITAVAVGGASESCTVNVISLSATATADYKDEYGVNHGKGIAIGGTVWAPVNCGYKAPTYDEDNNVTDKGFPYGKLYQWGRKYGQGYSEDYDSSVPTLEDGPVTMAYGQSENKSSYFFTSSSSPYDWASTQDDNLWNSGTDESPVRTDNDPCPKGWRVPTCGELEALSTVCSDWTTVDGMRGRYFSGVSTTKYDTPPMGEDVKIFFPAAGYRYNDGDANYRGYFGTYWSSDADSACAKYLLFGSSNVGMSNYYDRACGYSVRCVQE